MSTDETKEDTYVDDAGYVRYVKNKHLLHREIGERILGKKIPWNWDVHHIDLNKLNNQPTNLIVIPHLLHWALHQIIDEYPTLLRDICERYQQQYWDIPSRIGHIVAIYRWALGDDWWFPFQDRLEEQYRLLMNKGPAPKRYPHSIWGHGFIEMKE